MDNDQGSKSDTGKLDLGLSSLLEGAGKELKASLDQPGSLAEVLKKSVELSQAVTSDAKTEVSAPEISARHAPHQSEYNKFSEAGKWSDLSRFCEEKLSGSNDTDKIAKLWWIKSQFELRAIPVSILATSLNLIARDVLTSGSHSNEEKELCKELLIEFCKNLVANNDYELTFSFAGLLLENAPVSSRDLSKILGEAETRLRQESAFQDNSKILKELDELKSKHKLSLYNDVFDKIEITENTFSKKAEPAGQNSETQHKSASRKKYVYTAVFSALVLLIFLFSGTITGGITAVSGNLINMIAGTGGKSDFQPGLELIAVHSDYELVSPQPERMAGLNHIDAVFYEVSNAAARPQQSAGQVSSVPVLGQAAEVRPAQNSASQQSASSPPARLPNRSEQELSAVGQGGNEKVNTSYPLESGINLPPADTADPQDDMPEIDFPPYRSNSQKGRNGNTYTADRKPSANEPNYIIIARTRVMKEPTYWSEAAADLQTGDRVLVEEKLGKWLRIKAKNGNTGYILAQDADSIN